MSKRFPGRRLSPFRLTVLIAIVAALVAGSLVGYRVWQDDALADQSTPWFAAYVDATATPTYTFEAPQATSDRNVVLGFVVAAAEDDCAATWGSYQTLAEAQEDSDLDRRIARLQQSDGSVSISFGGEANTELALACSDTQELTQQYEQVVDRYDPASLDFDIEGPALADAASRERRADAVAELQKRRDEHLATWLTLPAGPDGLTPDGVATVEAFLEAGVHLDGVNAMTMNFTGEDAEEDQAAVAIGALEATHRQIKAILSDHDQSIGDHTAWRMVGATPMIGQNDVSAEVFGLDDARELSRFAARVGLGRMSMWSANRDSSCADAYTDLSVISDSCSGIDQGDERFSALLGAGFRGSPDASHGSSAPSPDPLDPDDVTDDPETSPYPIWDEDASYPIDTRIVWRRNVYAAKWWNSDVQPDDPALSPAENPWALIGPVLPGESPIEVRSLPDDFYPSWDQQETYLRGDRIMFDDLPYEAKWWNENENPAAGQADPGTSPWRVVPQREIEALLDR